MESFGEYLKKERESRNISLEEVSAGTKIRKVILEAIENDDVDALPATVFVKGFLRSYSRYLGLESSKVILQYHTHIVFLNKMKEERNFVDRNRTLYKPTVVIALVLILIFVFFVYFSQREKKESLVFIPVSPQTTVTESSTKRSSTKTPYLLMKKKEKVQKEREVSEEASVITPFSSEGGLILEGEDNTEKSIKEEIRILIRALDTTWLRVQLDDDIPFEIIMKRGDNLTWKAINKLKLFVGNAGGVELFYNGKPVGSIGTSGQVVSLTFPNEKIR